MAVPSVSQPQGPDPLRLTLMTIRHSIAPLFLFVVLAFPALAQASPDDVLRDCAADGSVDEKHSNKDKRAALRKMPGEMKEYTDCEAEISSSLTKPADDSDGGGGSAGGSGGGFNPDTDGDGVVSPAERIAAEKRKSELAQAATERQLGDRQTDPAQAGSLESGSTGGLSLPAILALVALLLIALGAGLYALWRRNPEFMRRVPIPFRGH